MTPDDPKDTLFGHDPQARTGSDDQPSQVQAGAEPKVEPPADVRGQCFIFCVRCGRPDGTGAEVCPFCGSRRCVGCSL